MQINAIVTGSTGMIGKGVILECLDNPQVGSVLAVGRQPSGISHPKLKEVLHGDFFDLSAIKPQLAGYNACFFCLGVTSAGQSEKEYGKVTYDLTLHVARNLKELNPHMTFCYVSGAGTDSTEKGRIMWARVKGRTENAILGLGFKDAYMFRPGLIKPLRGIRSRTMLYNLGYAVIWPIIPLLQRFPGFVTDTDTLARAMIHVAASGYEKKILETHDINLAGKN